MHIIAHFFAFFCDLITLIVIIINKKLKNRVIKSHKNILKKGIILIQRKLQTERITNMSIVNITKDNFDTEVLQSDKTVLLDFWAEWCGPCRMLAPTIHEIADERPDIKVGKVDVDNDPSLAEKFGVFSIPTLIVIKEGKVVSQTAGLRPKQAVLDLLD